MKTLMLRITKSNHFELPVEVSDELFEAVQISLKNKTWDNLTQEQKDYINSLFENKELMKKAEWQYDEEVYDIGEPNDSGTD